MQNLAKPAVLGRGRNVEDGWGNQEQAEFYRFADMLGRAGVVVQSEGGVTDAGDPWCVFERGSEPPEVVLHIAKTDDRYIASSPLLGSLEGPSLRWLMDQMLARVRGGVRWAL